MKGAGRGAKTVLGGLEGRGGQARHPVRTENPNRISEPNSDLASLLGLMSDGEFGTGTHQAMLFPPRAIRRPGRSRSVRDWKGERAPSATREITHQCGNVSNSGRPILKSGEPTRTSLQREAQSPGGGKHWIRGGGCSLDMDYRTPISGRQRFQSATSRRLFVGYKRPRPLPFPE